MVLSVLKSKRVFLVQWNPTNPYLNDRLQHLGTLIRGKCDSWKQLLVLNTAVSCSKLIGLVLLIP